MFGKKKKQALFNGVDDSRSVVNDFCQRTPYMSYRAVDYRLYHKLSEDEMLPKLEDHLAKLFAGSVDDANCNMLDTLIFGAAREGLPDLERQHIDHVDMLRRLIVSRKSNYADVRRIKEAREAELDAMKEDYDKICRMLVKEYEEV